MKGWPAVIVITGLAVVMLIALNVSMYRRMKAATAADRRAAERDPALPTDHD